MRQFLFKDQILTSPENGLLRLFYADKSTQYHGENPPKSNFIVLEVQIFISPKVSVPNELRFLKKQHSPSPAPNPWRCDQLVASKNQPHNNDMEDTMLEKNQFGLANGQASENVSG